MSLLAIAMIRGHSMKRFLVVSCVALSASGCAGLDPSKLIPNAVSAFQTAIGNVTATEAKLIAAWQAENKSLLYLSGDDYSCGDPKTTLYQKYVSSKNPSTLVTQDHVNKYWTSSLNYLTAYVKLLTAISTGAQNDQATIKQFVSLGSTAAAYIPGISSSAASSALTALGTLATDLRGAVAVEQISAAARTSQAPLATAVKYLKQYYPNFLENEQIAFNAWDECANEKLLFIRDQPLGRIATYKRTYFVTASALELDDAYAAYIAQRQSFLVDATVQSIDKTLDQILAQNASVADPTLTWATFQFSVQSLNTLYTDVSNAASAKKFGTPAKPVPAPKPPATKTKAGTETPFTVAWAD
jgi:hypothetical protein